MCIEGGEPVIQIAGAGTLKLFQMKLVNSGCEGFDGATLVGVLVSWGGS